MAFLQALQRKFLILHGNESFQIFFRSCFSNSAWVWFSGIVVLASVLRKKYLDFVAYWQDWTYGQKRASSVLVRLSAICLINSAFAWLNTLGSKVRSHCQVVGLMRELTVAFWSSAMRGLWSLRFCNKGSQLSPQSLIDSPFPTLHFAPCCMTSLPFKILF